MFLFVSLSRTHPDSLSPARGGQRLSSFSSFAHAPCVPSATTTLPYLPATIARHSRAPLSVLVTRPPANTVPCCAVIAPLPPSTRVGGNPFSSFAPRVAAFPIDCQSAIVRCAATVHTHSLSRTHSRRHAHARTHTHPSSRQRTQLSSITRVCLDNFPFATSPLLGLVSICLVCPLRSNQA